MVLYKRKLLLALVSLFTVFNLSLGSLGFAQEPNELASTSTTPSFNENDIVPGKVLVKYKQPAANGFQALSARSASSWTTLSFSNELSVSDKLAELQEDPNVEYAEPVYKFQISGVPQSEITTQSIYYDGDNMAYMENWGKTVTELTYASSKTPQQLSSHVVVAVVDTGIDLTHLDLKDSIEQGYDFVNNKNTPQDDNGHGTHVSGIIAAKAHDISGYTGVAPGTKIMPIKVLDQKGAGTTETVIAGIQYAIDHNANIINLSLGSDENSQALHEIIKQAVSRNILVVAAAGNGSNNWIKTESGQLDDPQTDITRKAQITDYPALYEEVISVGAVEQLDDTSLTVADFSNTIKVDVAAPGVNIYSTYLNSGYQVYAGTSQATPFVSGLAALIKANNPTISVANITSLIENTATPMPNLNLPFANVNRYGNNVLGGSDFYGNGLINGKKLFTLPRLEINPVIGTDNTVTLNVYDKDVYGNITDSNFYVSVYNYSIMEDSIFRDAILSSDLDVNGSLVHLINGQGSTTFHLSDSISAAYHYIFYVEDSSYQKHIRSNEITLIQKPNMPQADHNEGSYNENITVALSGTQGSEISYVLLNSDNDKTTKTYTGPITINKNSTLVTYSLKNHVYSDTAIYTYTIVPPTIPPVKAPVVGGGGGGGGGSSQQPPSLNADGKMAYEFKPAHVDLLILLNKALSDLTLDAKTKENVDILSVEMDADIVQKASQMNRPIVIASNDINLQIPPNAWPIKLSTGKILFTSSKTNTSIPNFTSASAIYDFSVTEDGSKISTFASPVKVTIPFDTKKVKDVHKLSVYVYDEAQGAWTPIDGTLNSDGTMTASLAHFSKYAVLEKQNDTILKDIKDHWAQKEIENLAGKGIIDGIDQDSFQPDTTLTRAQFVTIIAKALKLQQSDQASLFQDVSSDAWYRNSVYAAYSAGIISGMSEQTFVPDAPITREQMALTMVNAYLHATGKKLEDIVTTQEVKYADEGTISTWARSYVRIASALGLLSGTTGGQFAPSDNASRAQAAVVIYRLLNKVQ